MPHMDCIEDDSVPFVAVLCLEAFRRVFERPYGTGYCVSFGFASCRKEKDLNLCWCHGTEPGQKLDYCH